MTNEQIKRFLKSNGVFHLYHANTVETSISFLKNNGLLSRGLCEDMNLPQTPQYTDKSDKLYNIFYDIFFDSMEIQRRTGISYYGPVLFVYSVDVIDIVQEGHVRITKMNPDKWNNNLNDNEKYFCNFEELSIHFDKDDFGQHITLTDQRQPLSFNYLEQIILSDPQKEDNSLFDRACATISSLLIDLDFNIPLNIRDYSYNNRFFNEYSDNRKVRKHFGLGGHK